MDRRKTLDVESKWETRIYLYPDQKIVIDKVVIQDLSLVEIMTANYYYKLRTEGCRTVNIFSAIKKTWDNFFFPNAFPELLITLFMDMTVKF